MHGDRDEAVPPATGDTIAIRELQRGLQAIAGVRRIWLPEAQSSIQIWVLLDQATPEAIEQVFDLERAHLRRPTNPPIEVLVYGADEVDSTRLPGGQTLFERPTSRAASG